MGALKNEVSQLRRLVADLRGELGEILTRQNDLERSSGERLDHHREDLNWQREECILLRQGLQELEDTNAQMVHEMASMSRRLCRCHEGRGPPISAVGSPTPPPYPASPSEEFRTPPLEFMPIADLPSSPPSPTALPIPPPVSQSPISFPEQESTLPACCSNLSTTEGPLVPIEVESVEAEGSREVEESILSQVEEEAVPQLWRNNQSRAAGRRVVRASNLVRPHPYAHAKRVGSLLDRRTGLLRQLGGPESSSECSSPKEDCVLPHRAPNQWDTGSSGVRVGGQDEDLQVSGGHCVW